MPNGSIRGSDMDYGRNVPNSPRGHTNQPRIPRNLITPTINPLLGGGDGEFSYPDYMRDQGGLFSGIRRFFGRFTGQTQLNDAWAVEQYNRQNYLDDREWMADREDSYWSRNTEGMLEAGMNPALMYSGGGGGMPGGGSSQYGGMDTSGMEGGLPGVMGVIGQMAGVKTQIEMIKAKQLENLYNGEVVRDKIAEAKANAKTADERKQIAEMEKAMKEFFYSYDPEGVKPQGYQTDEWKIHEPEKGLYGQQEISRTSQMHSDALNAEHSEAVNSINRKFWEDTGNMSQYFQLAMSFLNILGGFSKVASGGK